MALYFDSFGIEYIPQEVLSKSKISISLATYLECYLMILLRVDIMWLQEKLCYFLLMTIKRMTR